MHKTLNENIYGNSAIVFHRTSVEDLINRVYTEGWKPREGSMYGKGFYSTYDLDSQLKDGMKETYGNIIVKFIVQGIENFFIFEYDEFIKSPNYEKLGKPSIDEFLKKQIEYFNLEKDLESLKFDLKKATSTLKNSNFSSDIALFFTKIINFEKRVNGIIFEGRRDGRVLVAYNTDLIVPISYSVDEGETFYKVPYNIEYLSKVVKNLMKSSNVKSIKPYSMEYYGLEYKKDYILSDKNEIIILKDFILNFMNKETGNEKQILKFRNRIKLVTGYFIVNNAIIPTFKNFPLKTSYTKYINCIIEDTSTLDPKTNYGLMFEIENCNFTEKRIDQLPESIRNLKIISSSFKEFGENVKNSTVTNLKLEENKSLVTLKNFPKVIANLELNKLWIESLEGISDSVEKINNNFIIKNMPYLKSLKGIPKHISGNFVLDSVSITDFTYLPEVVEKFIFLNNIKNDKEVASILEKRVKGFLSIKFNAENYNEI